jgi:argininosuccinate synthase
VVISFEQGLPTAIELLSDNQRIEGAVKLFSFLDDLAGQHGIGRGDVIVNRLMGIKFREIYEAPAATVLWLAHRDLEGLALDKQVLQAKEQLSWQIAESIYNGLCFGPELRLLMAAVEESQEDLTGKVTVSLHKGHCRVLARETVLSRYCTTLNRMEQSDAFGAEDVKGFLHIQSLKLQQRA